LIIPCIFIAILFVNFTSVYKRRYEKAIGPAVGFYWIQRTDSVCLND